MIYNKDDYEVKDAAPNRNDFKKFYVYKKGSIVAARINSIDLSVLAVGHKNLSLSCSIDKLQSIGYLIEIEFDEKAFKEAQKAYSRKVINLHEKYKENLFEFRGLGQKRINDILYAKAWESDRSEGYESVEEEFADLVDLIEDVFRVM